MKTVQQHDVQEDDRQQFPVSNNDRQKICMTHDHMEYMNKGSILLWIQLSVAHRCSNYVYSTVSTTELIVMKCSLSMTHDHLQGGHNTRSTVVLYYR